MEIESDNRRRGALLNFMVRESLSEQETVEQKCHWCRRSHAGVWGKRIPGRGSDRFRSSKAGISLVYSVSRRGDTDVNKSEGRAGRRSSSVSWEGWVCVQNLVDPGWITVESVDFVLNGIKFELE